MTVTLVPETCIDEMYIHTKYEACKVLQFGSCGEVSNFQVKFWTDRWALNHFRVSANANVNDDRWLSNLEQMTIVFENVEILVKGDMSGSEHCIFPP